MFQRRDRNDAAASAEIAQAVFPAFVSCWARAFATVTSPAISFGPAYSTTNRVA